MNCIIKQITVSDVDEAPNRQQLHDEYAQECSIKGLPHPFAKISLYKILEDTGSLIVFGSYCEDVLSGFIFLLSTVLPHYGDIVSTTESFFVLKEYRKTGAGLKLRRDAEIYAKSLGSPGLLISAPKGGELDKLLASDKSYAETNRVYFKRFD